jgi:hypothetical protein
VLIHGSELALAQETAVVVKVLDKRKLPVVGTVFLNPGKLQLGRTSPTGEYRFNHKCALGQTFKAEPEDRAKYYDSEEQVCGKVVELEVFPRPQHSFDATKFAVFKLVDSTAVNSNEKVYAGIFGGVTDKVEAIPGGRVGKCRLTLDKKYGFGAYSAESNKWMKLEELGLTVGGPSDDSVYIFPTTCDEARPQILELVKQANMEVKAAAKTYSNSPDIGEAVTKAMKGVKF